jgi:branched-subunit amino acid transport protein AzlD
MTTKQLIISVLLMAAITYGTRLLPFIIFGRGEKPAPIILYLGKFLPPALICTILVYCFKDTQILSMPFGIPEVIASLLVVGLHYKLGNTMLSIFAGTVTYMLLLHIC